MNRALRRIDLKHGEPVAIPMADAQPIESEEASQSAGGDSGPGRRHRSRGPRSATSVNQSFDRGANKSSIEVPKVPGYWDNPSDLNSSRVSSFVETSTTRWLAEHRRTETVGGSALFHAPTAAFQAPGGGENQLIQTARHLESEGHAIRLFCPWTDRLDEARLLHLFGMSHEGLALARVARSRRIPVVLSPICWAEPWSLRLKGQRLTHGMRDLASWAARRISPIPFGWRHELLSLADAVLPNSRIEADQLVRLYGADPARIHVVPNGVEARFAEADPSRFQARVRRDDFVLYVGRIEPRKNVLGLIRALGNLGYPLVAIGDVVPGHETYAEQCRGEGRGRVQWLPRLDHANPLLQSSYAAARVFALPSQFETPGLSALEAGLAGCAVVLTPNGATREYFGDLVQYARPHRLHEIATAISTAWTAGPHPALAGHVAEHFLWNAVARKTSEIYDHVAR